MSDCANFRGKRILLSESGSAEAGETHASICAAWFGDIRDACGPFEWITYAYLVWLTTIVIIREHNIKHAIRHVVIQLAIALAIALLVRSARSTRSGPIRFARHWYPLPLYIFFFEELQSLVHAIWPEWFDAFLVAFDHGLFGVHPSVWLSRFSSPGINDFMQFSYMTYFLYLLILPAILYGRREYSSFWTVMVSTAVAHYSVYVVAVLFPIESPYYSLASLNTVPLKGGYCTALIGIVEHFGRVHGAAFPSAHVAGSMVAILASWRYRRWLFWACLPFFGSMCVATVYGRYHYAADVFAGLLVGAFGFKAGTRLMRRNMSTLENLLLPAQIAERAEIRNQEDKPVLALIADRAE